MNIYIITVSDRASRGEYEDLSGPEAEKLLREGMKLQKVTREIVPDEPENILDALTHGIEYDLILTTGGTGMSERDITPEITEQFCDRELPGIAEAIRRESEKETPFALLSRGYSGQKGPSLVVNLPGSVKAVRTGVRVLLPVLQHAGKMIRGEGHEEKPC